MPTSILRSPFAPSTGVPNRRFNANRMRIPQRQPTPTAADLAALLRRLMFLAGNDPGWDDYQLARDEVSRFFSRDGSFDPESVEVVMKVYRKAVGL